MAGAHSMTSVEVVRKVLLAQADVIREAVENVCQEVMEVEVSALIEGELSERTPDQAAHHNGYRPRQWQTRAGTVELQIPKLRRGSYFPVDVSAPAARVARAALLLTRRVSPASPAL